MITRGMATKKNFHSIVIPGSNFSFFFFNYIYKVIRCNFPGGTVYSSFKYKIQEIIYLISKRLLHCQFTYGS